MSHDVQPCSRAQVAAFLPLALHKALASYRMFSAKTEKDPKDFKDRHNACKAALAHIELLLKLAKWAALPDDTLTDESDQSNLKGLIDAAKGEVDAFGETDDS